MFFDMQAVSAEFFLVTLLLLLIFIINISHILHLILNTLTHQVKSVRLLLINSSICSLIVSLWLLPGLYFRTVWSAESIFWRLWSFFFHLVDAVQLYTLLILITGRSLQKFLLSLIWLAPIVAYSPLLWLPSTLSFFDDIDYLPFQILIVNTPWWIFPLLYFIMYLIPMIVSLILTSIRTIWPLIDQYYEKRTRNLNSHNQSKSEHQEDMLELKNLINTVFNFQLQQPKSISKSCYTSPFSSSKLISNKINRSLSSKVAQHKSLVLFDDSSTYSLMHSLSTRTKNSTEQSLNSCVLLIITCLLLLVHLPYILLSLIDVSLAKLSIFIYIHWLGTLFIPIIHLK